MLAEWDMPVVGLREVGKGMEGLERVLSCVRLFVTPWTVTRQAPLSMGFSRQEYCSGLPFPTPGDFLEPGIEPMSPASPALAGGFVATEPPGKQSHM